jgi:KDO2-lipid IV(A) lauroyltransferase
LADAPKKSGPFNSLVELIQASALWLFWKLSGLLPVDWASNAGRVLFSRIGPRLLRSAKIRRNLQTIFPEKEDAAIEELVGQVWGNFGAVMAELPHLQRIGSDPGRVEVECKFDTELVSRPDHPAVFACAHLANWELSVVSRLRFQMPRLVVVHNEQPNRWVRRQLQRYRERLGAADFVPKSAGLRPLLRLLDEGVSVGLLPDQKFANGEWVPFFGLDALTAATPARLALRKGCPLIPLRCERVGTARYRVVLAEPVEPDDANASDQEKAWQMTRNLNRRFEEWIRRHPGDWWCPKRRWPKHPQAAEGSTGTGRSASSGQALEKRD